MEDLEKKEVPTIDMSMIEAMAKKVAAEIVEKQSAQPAQEMPVNKAKAPKDLDKPTAFRNYFLGAKRKERTMFEEAYHALGGEDFSRAYNSEGTDADGGYSVPPVFHTEIIQQAQEESVLFTDCDVVRTNSKQDKFNFLDGSTTIYFPGSEATDITSSKMTQDQFSVDQVKYGALCAFSNELLNDAPTFMNNVQRNIQDRLKSKYNEILFTLTTPYDGILSSDLTDSVTNPTTYDLTGISCGATVDGTSLNNLLDGINAVSSDNLNRAKFYGSRSVRSALSKIAINTTGQPLILQQFMTGGIMKTLMDYEYKAIEEMPASSAVTTSGIPFLVFGDLKTCCKVVVNTDVRMMVSDQGYADSKSFFQADMTGIRLIGRLGFKVFVPKRPDGQKLGLVRFKLA